MAFKTIPIEFERLSAEDWRVRALRVSLAQRRSVRDFAPDPVPPDIAVGMLLTALHTAGLATLTHTPSPMGFLREILGRPKNERPYLLIPVGYPARDARVPDIGRKPLAEVRLVV